MTKDQFVAKLLEILQSHPNALRILMATKTGRRALLCEAQKEYSDENIRFLLAVDLYTQELQHLKESRETIEDLPEVLQAADRIINKYVVTGSDDRTARIWRPNPAGRAPA